MLDAVEQKDAEMYSKLSYIMQEVNQTMTDAMSSPDQELEQVIQNPEILKARWQEMVNDTYIAEDLTASPAEPLVIPTNHDDEMQDMTTDDMDYTDEEGSGMFVFPQLNLSSIANEIDMSEVDAILSEDTPRSAALTAEVFVQAYEYEDISILIVLASALLGILLCMFCRCQSSSYTAGSK